MSRLALSLFVFATGCATEAQLAASPMGETPASELAAAGEQACDASTDARCRWVTVEICLETRHGNRSYDIVEYLADYLVDYWGAWYVTEEVCGDDVDNDCNDEIDEECCPLWDDFGGLPEDGEFDGYEWGYTFAADASPDELYSYTDVYFYGWSTDGRELRFSVDFWDYGTVHEASGWGDGFQTTTWTYTDEDGATSGADTEGEISAEVYAVCTDEAFDWAAALDAVESWDERDGE